MSAVRAEDMKSQAEHKVKSTKSSKQLDLVVYRNTVSNLLILTVRRSYFVRNRVPDSCCRDVEATFADLGPCVWYGLCPLVRQHKNNKPLKSGLLFAGGGWCISTKFKFSSMRTTFKGPMGWTRMVRQSVAPMMIPTIGCCGEVAADSTGSQKLWRSETCRPEVPGCIWCAPWPEASEAAGVVVWRLNDCRTVSPRALTHSYRTGFYNTTNKILITEQKLFDPSATSVVRMGKCLR